MSEHPGERLSAFVDGELEASARAAIENHLAECVACREEVETLRRLQAAAKEAPPLDEVTERRFLAEHRSRRAAVRKEAPARGAGAFGWMSGTLIAAAIVVITLSIFVALGGPLRQMFENAVGTQTMGQNQAALSAGIY